ncbi:MAG: cytochrome c biogenesis protein CcsA [Phycisphaerales bacterium]|nr:cytochrome c biogenesis protein CcsA [Phycisphaerales bacterium]
MILKRIIKAQASLKLTVLLLSLAMILIFVGTLAQTRLGVWQAVDTYFRSWVAFIDFGLIAGGEPRGAGIPFPGGLSIAGVMIVNLVAAHIVRFKATRKRIGILVLHAGLIMLLLGEFVTGYFANEGLMTIDEGQSSSYLEDIREVEIAIIDPSHQDHDRVVSIPMRMIVAASRTQQPIHDELMPFSIRIDEWMPNAQLFRIDSPHLATNGIGLEARAQAAPQVSGVEGGKTDAPASYVTLFDGNEPIGTWLLSSQLTDLQRVDRDDKAYGIAMRYTRTYLPYELSLIDFSHDTFTGTSIAKNFSSDVRITDPARGTDREVRIWMNNPLRYGGRTFYQASYKPDGSGTVLQVVRNPGWLMPYLSCILVTLGMTWHFLQSITAFLRRRMREGPVAFGAAPAPRSRVDCALPIAAGCLGVLIAFSGLLRPIPASDLDTSGFARLPVSSGGRIKPMDTAARSMLMVAGGKQSVASEEGEVSAVRFLIDLIAKPENITGIPLVRVDHPDVLALLGKDPTQSGRVPLGDLEPHWEQITLQARHALTQEPKQRDGFQRAIIQLHDRVNRVLEHAQMRQPYSIPPLSADGQWQPFHDAFLDDQVADTPHPSVAYLTTIMNAASRADSEGFAQGVDSYTRLLEDSMPGVMREMHIEVWFNRASLFTGTTAVYLAAFISVCASFIARAGSGGSALAERLRSVSWVLLVVAVLVHTLAIGLRIYLQDRPPVTNLYSSAIFVGWAAALAGIFIERLFRLGIAVLGSATIGAATLIIAHNLGNDGDTMQMMQAVLDSNFWLATHVIAITLGYSATFLAGAIAMIYLLARAITRKMTPERERSMIRMVYGVACFALLLSFVGTVLGGIWADQSWGRFWGWDPKENGAALVVLINAIILHARWGGMIRAKGIAILAVAGNIVTVWSWFGTNMLGVGLHAYGFMDSASMWLAIFVGTQLLVMSTGFIPKQRTGLSRSIESLQ